MSPSLKVFMVITCARYAVVALTVYAAWTLDSGAFLLVALLIALFGGYDFRSRPDVCPKCGHVIKQPDEEA